jgi:hypothetical protein
LFKLATATTNGIGQRSQIAVVYPFQDRIGPRCLRIVAITDPAIDIVMPRLLRQGLGGALPSGLLMP